MGEGIAGGEIQTCFSPLSAECFDVTLTFAKGLLTLDTSFTIRERNKLES